MTTTSDPPEELVFADWYQREFPRVARALALASGDPLLGEEAAAEAFARALAIWPKVHAMESPGGWVYSVALSELRRTWRRRRLERRSLDRLHLEHVPAPTAPDDALWQAVAQLAPRARTAIALRYVADLTEADIADVMNIARGTVAATLFAARKQLATALAPHLTGDRS
ncbi:RNA polymerase sigma factor [Sanguibacter suarezii]|uniref:RNA polymerase sigma factor n=1 Tax=Sanguibacter suarezii TaxID=60921 RepID=UPI00082EEE96|nr:sigma-70 family RNA polymerase sigma factor [Sanguibacter suarezii]